MIYLKPLLGRKVLKTPMPNASNLDIFKMVGRAPMLATVGLPAPGMDNGNTLSNEPAPAQERNMQKKMEMGAPSLKPPGM